MIETFYILIQMSREIVPKGLIDNKAALAQVMVGRRTSGKPLSEPMLPELPVAYMLQKGEGGGR